MKFCLWIRHGNVLRADGRIYDNAVEEYVAIFVLFYEEVLFEDLKEWMTQHGGLLLASVMQFSSSQKRVEKFDYFHSSIQKTSHQNYS